MKLTRREVIKETNYGCWVWEMPDGNAIADDEGHFMLIFGSENDLDAKKAISDAAKYYGFDEGKAVYWQDVRPVSDEEYEEQLYRAQSGLTPDPLDVGAINDEMEQLKRGY